MNIILCGLPGSGKSTVGSLLAKRLQYHFIDTDSEVQKLYSRMNESPITYSCREITKREGVTQFRQLEHQVIVETKSRSKTILTTGGGVIEFAPNIPYLQAYGKLFYLQASPELIIDRVMRTGCPSYLDPDDPLISFQTLAKKRLPLYEQVCHYVIETDHLSVEEVIAQIKDCISDV